MSIAPANLLGPYRTVFDVGAFRGDFARACFEEWPECTVHSFEPLEPIPKLQWQVNGWFWHACALGNQCEVVEMYRNVFVPSSSVLPMAALHEEAFPYTKGSEVVRVGMATLEEFGSEIVAPALLKIDVQGYELEVLKGAGEFLSAFQGVVFEVSHAVLYEGAPTYADLSAYLLGHGYKWRARVDEMYHPKSGLLLQSDELWVRIPVTERRL